MAIYHVDVATCSKASNPKVSGYAKASYILREGPYAKRPDKPAIVFVGNMPSWAQTDPKTISVRPINTSEPTVGSARLSWVPYLSN